MVTLNERNWLDVDVGRLKAKCHILYSAKAAVFGHVNLRPFWPEFCVMQTAGCFACDHFSTDLGPSVPGANHSTVVVRPVPV